MLKGNQTDRYAAKFFAATAENNPVPAALADRASRRVPLVQGVDRLTPRQREILKLLAQGFYYKEIGATLGISHCTVRAHLHSVYQRLEVKSRARAVVKFHEHSSAGPAKAACL